MFDWKTNDQLKYSSSECIYTSTLTIDNLNSVKKYYIDLGKVYYSADLKINDKIVGSAIYSPFVFDITPYIKKGDNTIKIVTTPTKYNEFVEEADKGNKLYKTLKRSELMSEGLVGPVSVYQQ